MSSWKRILVDGLGACGATSVACSVATLWFRICWLGVRGVCSVALTLIGFTHVSGRVGSADDEPLDSTEP